MKDPTTAAMLNLIPLPVPLGYVYLGSWERAAGFLLVRIGAAILGIWPGVFFAFVLCGMGCSHTTGYLIWGIVLGPSAAVIAYNAWDAFRIAPARRSRGR